jgi:hypothetical protein
MLKNISKLECKIGEKEFQLTCDMDCSTQLLKHALIKFLRYVDEVEEKGLESSIPITETIEEPQE